MNLSQKGISLIEVLAAMVILSLGASVAFTWFGQSVTTMSRLKAEEAQLLARNEAMEVLRAVNPVDKPQGSIAMPGYHVQWTSHVVGEPVRTLTTLGTASRYEVSLHELNVVLSRDSDDGKPWVGFNLELAGYRQVAASSTSVFGSSP